MCVFWGKGGQHWWLVQFTLPGSKNWALSYVTCPVFSFQGGTQRRARFTMESTSEFKNRRGKTISNTEFPAF